jgi:hypothetical protein
VHTGTLAGWPGADDAGRALALAADAAPLLVLPPLGATLTVTAPPLLAAEQPATTAGSITAAAHTPARHRAPLCAFALIRRSCPADCRYPSRFTALSGQTHCGGC